MADHNPNSFGRKLLSWAPFVLPVIGGAAGMIIVNSTPEAFLNPVIAVAGGAVAGWGLSALIVRLADFR